MMLAALVVIFATTVAPAVGSPLLWPKPTYVKQAVGASTTSFSNLSFVLPADADTSGVLARAAERYAALIRATATPDMKGASRRFAPQYEVDVRVEDMNVPLTLGSNMNESYTLDAGDSGCTLSARTVWGALRGMETFSQLVFSSSSGDYQLTPVSITDMPRFGWRGLMIDTGRNYLTTTTIKMALDAMAYTKLNLLHWHIVDDQSFALKSETLPRLAGDGAFSPKHTYSIADVKSIVAYARDRGIAVLPELDCPGHSTSWQRGYPEIGSKCSNAIKRVGTEPQVGAESGFTTPMDPTANATYKLLNTLLGELDPLFPAEFGFWHLGGDEVQYDCWQNSDGGYMAKFMKEHGIKEDDYPGLQAYFEQRVIQLVKQLPSSKRTVLWEDNSKGHTSGLPKDAVVELWKEHHGDSSVLDATVQAGWEVFYTTPDWYFDHGKTLTDGSWEFDYAVEPFANSTLDDATLNKAVLGGESCMWSPHFDSTNFMTEAFPRAAAVAERLWSERSITSVDDARVRLHAWRCRLLQRGLATGPVAGGVPTGASGKAPASPTTTFGGHCPSGPWEQAYSPPF